MSNSTSYLLTRARIIGFLGASFAIGVFSAFNNFTLSLWLNSFITSLIVISLLGNSRSFEGAFVSPIFGAWSDRLWTGWLGRRRPFILVGGLLSALLLALTPAISRLGGDATLLALTIVAIFFFTFAFNTMDDIHKALMTDISTPAQRNWLSGLSVVVNMAGNVGILVLGFFLWKDEIPDSAFVITGALVAAGVLLTVAGVPEPSPAAWNADRQPEAGDSGSRLSAIAFLAKYRGAAVLCLVVFAYWSGVNAVLPLISIYTKDILGATTGQAQLLPGLLLLSTTVLALPVARLGNRFGKRRVLGAGYAIMGMAALAGLVITTVGQGVVVFVLAGVGNAASSVLAIPLLADLVPRQRMGVAAGILAASGSVAAPISSLVAGALADATDARAIFAVMAVMVVVALALLPFVRRPSELAATPVPAGALAAEARDEG